MLQLLKIYKDGVFITMKCELVKSVEKFFEKHYLPASPLLLGFSGGSDSTVLFHILLLLKKKFSINLHIVHIDHGWREESSLQAASIERGIKEQGLPFYLFKLNSRKGPNLEARCRQMRLSCFKSLFDEIKFQALLLAHQREDLSETVLKRVFEGASLPYLGGMKEISRVEGMVIWRPLLFCSKRRISAYLKENHLNFIDDETNRDSCFLRARMREEIVPTLENIFGKKVEGNLANISLMSNELQDYLDAKTSSFYGVVTKGPFGILFDFNLIEKVPSFEKKFFLRKILKEATIILSKKDLEKALLFLENKRMLKEKRFLIERGHLFILNEEVLKIEPRIVGLRIGQLEVGCWRVTVSEHVGEKEVSAPSWKEVFKGKAELIVPQDKGYSIGIDSDIANLNKLGKVPLFLRKVAPVLYKDGAFFAGFFSGDKENRHFLNNSLLRISIINKIPY